MKSAARRLLPDRIKFFFLAVQQQISSNRRFLCTFIFARAICPLLISAQKHMPVLRLCNAHVIQVLAKVIKYVASGKLTKARDLLCGIGVDVETSCEIDFQLLKLRKRLVKHIPMFLPADQSINVKGLIMDEQMNLLRDSGNSLVKELFTYYTSYTQGETVNSEMDNVIAASVNYNETLFPRVEKYNPGSLSVIKSNELAHEIRVTMKAEWGHAYSIVQVHKCVPDLLGVIYALFRETTAVHYTVPLSWKRIIAAYIFGLHMLIKDILSDVKETSRSVEFFLQQTMAMMGWLENVSPHAALLPCEGDQAPEIFAVYVLYSYFKSISKVYNISDAHKIPHAGSHNKTKPMSPKRVVKIRKVSSEGDQMNRVLENTALKFALISCGKPSLFDVFHQRMPAPSPNETPVSQSPREPRLSPEFSWASSNQIFSKLFARWSRAEDTLSKQMLTPACRLLLIHSIRKWKGEDVDAAWIEDAVRVLPNVFEELLAEICLSAVFLPGRVDSGIIKRFKKAAKQFFNGTIVKQMLLVGASFTSFMAAKKRASWLKAAA
eukprot:TRINITY_DN11804_c0_g1_i1.p1 TRINITY_DN11804_c0_g1~~TRINITY_DN11804_c0_g1_i1.p1  ORF type:complete len:617 (-),score=55.23 TRINITY_DN11804_c0_g1_i1:162-1808(-)